MKTLIGKLLCLLGLHSPIPDGTVEAIYTLRGGEYLTDSDAYICGRCKAMKIVTRSVVVWSSGEGITLRN